MANVQELATKFGKQGKFKLKNSKNSEATEYEYRNIKTLIELFDSKFQVINIQNYPVVVSEEKPPENSYNQKKNLEIGVKTKTDNNTKCLHNESENSKIEEVPNQNGITFNIENKVLKFNKHDKENTVELRKSNKYTPHRTKLILNYSKSNKKSKLEYIINELVQSEENFVSTLRLGYENYQTIFNIEKSNDFKISKSLIGKKYVLFRTIDEILDFHENEMLPMLKRNQNDLQALCSSLSEFIKEHKFYPHLLYIMHKRRAENLCKQFEACFNKKAKELEDKLGITSLLMQPMQRITKYPLLLQQLINECFNDKNNMKSVLDILCKTERKLNLYIQLINVSEHVGNVKVKNTNLYELGRLKNVETFEVYDYNLLRRFQSRVFLFEKALVYTEIVMKLNGEKLKFQGLFSFCNLSNFPAKCGFILVEERNDMTHKCDFLASSEITKDAWLSAIKKLNVSNKINEGDYLRFQVHKLRYVHLYEKKKTE